MTLLVLLRCIYSSSQERPFGDPVEHQPKKEERRKRKENGEMSPVGDMTDHGDGDVHPVTIPTPLDRLQRKFPQMISIPRGRSTSTLFEKKTNPTDAVGNL